MAPNPGPTGFCRQAAILVAALLATLPLPAVQPPAFRLAAGAVVSVRGPGGREYLAPGARLGAAAVRCRAGAEPWREAGADVAASSTFRRQGGDLLWTLTVRNRTARPLEVGDLAVPLPMNTDFGKPGALARSVLKHSFISGHGSFLYWVQPGPARPILTLVPTGDTALEYWDNQGGYRVFIHAAAALADLGRDGTWRQPGTRLALAPAGSEGDRRDYGFRLRWVAGYDGVRRMLAASGKLDVHVVPGMTVPADLPVRFLLRSSAPVTAVEAEFPDRTEIQDLGAGPGGGRIYQARFGRLGENRLTVRQGDRHTYLEFFSTEPLATLIRKRGAFIAGHQQRDPSKWYDGLLAEWNMASGKLLGPDDYDQIKGWRIYEVTCDDPGLSKPAFLAGKLAEFPVQAEVDALDRYVERFLWGGLQRTRDEADAYAVYGIPDWKRNRESADPGPKGRRHYWRVYDYPHVVATYLGLYRVAREQPWIRTSQPAGEYLRRAAGTALAMFTVPMAVIQWSGYETGYYNETVIPGLLEELETAGLRAEAADLRRHWERKVAHFLSGRADLYGSEYPFDSTGFESSHALARYALDKDPRDPRARAFMERQLAGNLFCRGWLEPAYYLLGSDLRGGEDAYTLSYMAPMGGGAVLDYALRDAADPAPMLRLGYASLLSSWALMNTGTPASDYGYWFPGQANDGAAGGGFEPAALGTTWLGQPHHRGAWYYSCETDLGYCGYLRGAATVLCDDPLFGRTCLGGLWHAGAGGLDVEPRDGVRRRFHALLGGRRLHAELDNDRFRALTVSEDLGELRFTLESDNPAPHPARLRITGAWRITGPDGTAVHASKGRVDLPVRGGGGSYHCVRETR